MMINNKTSLLSIDDRFLLRRIAPNADGSRFSCPADTLNMLSSRPKPRSGSGYSQKRSTRSGRQAVQTRRHQWSHRHSQVIKRELFISSHKTTSSTEPFPSRPRRTPDGHNTSRKQTSLSSHLTNVTKQQELHKIGTCENIRHH